MPNLSNRIHPRHLQLILAIRETGQLALAAERLSMTQPAASRMLVAIERTIGMNVFERHPKGMTATLAGEVLSRNAMSLLNGLDQTLREIDAINSGRAGVIRVGAVTGGAVAFVIPAIRELKRTAIGSEIHVDVAPSNVLIDSLLKGEHDFVLSRIPPGTDARQFEIRRGRVELIQFLVRRDHPLTGREGLRLADLAGFEWVIQAPQTPLRQAVEEAFVSRGLELPSEMVNTTSLLFMIAYLASSNAIAPISREVAELIGPGSFGGSVVALEVAEPIIVHPYHLISRKNQIASPLAMRLRELVFKALNAHSGPSETESA